MIVRWTFCSTIHWSTHSTFLKRYIKLPRRHMGLYWSSQRKKLFPSVRKRRHRRFYLGCQSTRQIFSPEAHRRQTSLFEIHAMGRVHKVARSRKNSERGSRYVAGLWRRCLGWRELQDPDGAVPACVVCCSLSVCIDVELTKPMNTVETAMFVAKNWNRSAIMPAQYAMVRTSTRAASQFTS